MEERYQRNAPIIPPDLQPKMACLPVAIIGLGGLGGAIAEQLVRLGFLNFTLIDFDVFGPSNLNRQRFSTEENLGRPKVEVVAEALQAIDSRACVRPLENPLTADNADRLLADQALIFDALDSAVARRMLSDIAEDKALPVVHGAVGGWIGQAAFIAPGANRLSALYPSKMNHIEDNNLPMVVNTVAAIQVAEAVKWISGAEPTLYNRLLMFDFRSYDVELIPL